MKKFLVSLAATLMLIGVKAETQDADGITWTYTVVDGVASVGSGSIIGDRAVPKSTTGAITIPATLGGYPVTGIGEYAFYNCSGLTSVTIPDSVTSIGTYAFSGCSGLTSVAIPDGVTSLEYSFYGCSGLKSVTIPDSVTSIGSYAFYNCSGLTSVTMGNGVTSIGEFAFCRSGLTSVTIPDSVTNIVFSAFEKCSSLESVTIPDSVTRIGGDAFSDCHSDLYDTTTIPGVKLVDGWIVGYTDVEGTVDLTGARGIAESAFNNCSGLTSVIIPDNITSIAESAFSSCSGLTSVTIPDGVTRIGPYVFFYCTGLTNVTISGSVTSIGNSAFSSCTGLTSVTFKGDAPDVGYHAFNDVAENCEAIVAIRSTGWGVAEGELWNGLVLRRMKGVEWFIDEDTANLENVEINGVTEVTLPDTIVSVGYNAFEGCGELTSVTIPDGVTSIHPTAFDGCEKLWAKWFKTLERLSSNDVAAANEVALTVTNVVVHYVTQSVPSTAVTPSEDVGIVNVIAEVSAGKPVAMTSQWAEQYPAFTEKFGSNFTAAITMKTGKRDAAGNDMFVWQDFVAGTDPTDEDDKFTASIAFDDDGKPVISWTPELSAAEAAKRSYKKYGKVKLTDSEWSPIDDNEATFNFFKVLVEMK